MRQGVLSFVILAFCHTSTVHGTEAVGLFPKTRIGLRDSLYSGEKGKSLAETSNGYGLGVSVFLEGRHFVPLFSFYTSATSGRQTFLDGNSTQVISAFNYYSASTEIGFQFYPIERRKNGFNVYISGCGVIGYNYISLSRSTTLTTIPYSDQSFSAGYSAGIGTEAILGGAGPSKWTINGEVLLKKESATLLIQQYDLSNLGIALGLGW